MTEPRHHTVTERSAPQAIRHVRRFDAPAEAVRWAHLSSDLFSQWVGPHGSTMRIERWDTITGGAFDYTVSLGGDRYRFRGAYHRVDARAIVHTWEFVGDPIVTLEHLTFTPIGEDACELEVTSLYDSVQVCDDMLASDMGQGMIDNFARLDAVLAARR